MLGIQSPSRVFATLGSALSLGLAQGVASAGPAVVDTVGQLARSLQDVPLSLARPDMTIPALWPPATERLAPGLAVSTLNPVQQGMPVPAGAQAQVRPGNAIDAARGQPDQVDDPLRWALPEVKPVSMGLAPTAPSAPGNTTISGTPSIHFAPQISMPLRVAIRRPWPIYSTVSCEGSSVKLCAAPARHCMTDPV